MKLRSFSLTCCAVLLVFYGCGDNLTRGEPPSSGAPGRVGPNEFVVNIAPGASGRTLDAFVPNPLSIPAGSTVTWVNFDTVDHTATSFNGSWDTGVIKPGDRKTQQFNTSGTFPFSCRIYPNMTGSISVLPSPSPLI